MPNVGRRSGACESCKRMKVKCDEERPYCRRCRDVNRVCPGYGPRPDDFRRANVASQGRVVQQNADKKELFDDEISKGRWDRVPVRHKTTIAPRESRILPTLLPGLPSDHENVAVNMFLFRYTIPTSDPVYGGHLGSLDEYYHRHQHISYLRHAMLAVSLAVLVQQTDRVGGTLGAGARLHRSKALQGVQHALKDESCINSDSALLALFLLERFELLSGENQSSKVWYNHSVGMSAMLRARGPAQLDSVMGRELFRWISVQLRVKDLSYGSQLVDTDPSLPDGAKLRSLAGGRQAHAMQSLSGLYRRLKYAAHFSDMDERRAAIGNTLNDAMGLRSFFEIWLPDVPVPATKRLVKMDTPTSSGAGPSDVYTFARLTEGMAFSSFWNLRLRWARLVLDCLRNLAPLSIASVSLLDSHQQNQRVLLWTEMCELLARSADEVSRVIPFLADGGQSKFSPVGKGDVRGCAFASWGSLWPINTLCCTPELDDIRPGLRQWSMSRLLDLGDRVGFKQAFAFYEVFKRGFRPGRA